MDLGQIEAKRGSIGAQVRLRFSQGHKEAPLASGDPVRQEVQAQGCFAAPRTAAHETGPLRNQSTMQHFIQTRHPGGDTHLLWCACAIG